MHQYATREVSLRAAPPLAERERMAPQAKPPAGRGFGGSAPNYSKQSSLRAARAGVAALVILEYGSMM